MSTKDIAWMLGTLVRPTSLASVVTLNRPTQLLLLPRHNVKLPLLQLYPPLPVFIECRHLGVMAKLINLVKSHWEDTTVYFQRKLVERIMLMERALFGLTTIDVRKLAFEMAERMKIRNPFNTHSKLAARDWLRGFFLSRHPCLSIREPIGTSLNRAIGFNRTRRVSTNFRTCWPTS